MASVTQLAQFLLSIEPQKNAARLALYNYLKNTADSGDEIASPVFEDFFSHCLNYPYWQDRREDLLEMVTGDLKAFFSRNSTEGAFDFEALNTSCQRQVIHLQNKEDRLKCLEHHLISLNDARVRALQLENGNLLGLQLLKDGCLIASTFSPAATVRDGCLQPLVSYGSLKYNSKMELMKSCLHGLAVSYQSWARFEIGDDGVKGTIMNGYLNQKSDKIQAPAVTDSPALASALRQLERHFVDPKSDPLYQEIIDLLEKTYQLINIGASEADRYAEVALERGKYAIKNLFPNDKLLLLLVTNIEYWVIQNGRSKPGKAPAVRSHAEKTP